MNYQSNNGIVGSNVRRQDAIDKVKGTSVYPDDIEYEGMLYAGALRSTIPYGKLVSIDYNGAEKISGVEAIINYDMIPGEKTHGVVIKDQPVLVKDIIKRVGDPLLVVVAKSKKILAEAMSKITVNYEEYTGIFTVEDALKKNACIIGGENNILYKIKIEKGNIQEGFNKAAYTAENWYHTPAIDHGFLQPEATVAIMKEDGTLELNVATQYPHYDREELSRCLNIPEEKINVKNTSVGGAFGAREDITLQLHAALASYYTKKPVKIVYSREESTITHCKRHGMDMYFKTCADEEGKLCAIKARIYGDTGAYCSWGMNVLRKAAVHATGPYEVDNVDIEAYAVYTNNSFSGAMRGFGAAQAAIGYESQMDILAHKIGINPLKFRYMNTMKVGSKTATGQLLSSSVGIDKCIEKLGEIDNIGLR